jgi:hypothetical protein
MGAFEQDDYTPDAFDNYLNAELLLPGGDNIVKARVVKRTRGEDGNPIGLHHKKPLFDSREYTVEFPDGSTAEYTGKYNCRESVFAGRLGRKTMYDFKRDK